MENISNTIQGGLDKAEEAAHEAIAEVTEAVEEAAEQVTAVVEQVTGGDDDDDKYPLPDADFEHLAKAAQEESPFASVEGQTVVAALSHVEKLDTETVMVMEGAASTVTAAGFELPYWLFGLVIEIWRDFFQLLSLILTFVIAIPDIDIVFGRLSFIISLDFSVAFGVNPKTLFIATWFVIFVLSMVFMFLLHRLINNAQPQPRREFILLRTWSMLDPAIVRRMKITTFILTLLYQPVSQYALEIVLCSYRFRNMMGECNNIFFMITAIIALFVVTFVLPIYLVRLITANVPKVREYDVNGYPATYTAQMYQVDLAKMSEHSPLASLFNMYRRPMSKFKVIVMALKLYLVVVAVGFSSNNYTGFGVEDTPAPGPLTPSPTTTGTPIPFNATLSTPEPVYIAVTSDDTWNHLRAILMILGLVVYTIVVTISRPFLSSLANLLDSILRTFAILVALGSYMVMLDLGSGPIKIIMIVILSFALLTCIVFTVLGSSAVQEKIRIIRGDVTLTPVSDDDESPVWFKPTHVNFPKERKNRVWHGFWDNFLSYFPPFQPPVVTPETEDEDDVAKAKKKQFHFDYADTEDTAAYLLAFRGSVCERHHENREIVVDLGRDHYRGALKPLSKQEEDGVVYATRMLHGRDCFIGTPDDANRPGSFGCFYIVPFPFQSFFIRDQTNVETQLQACEMLQLAKDNAHPEVRRRRDVRQKLRGLGFSDQLVYFFFQEYQTVKVPAGTDNQGRQQYKNVQVLVTFERGKFAVAQDYDTPVFQPQNSDREVQVTPGFKPSLYYSHGDYDHPETGHRQSDPRTLSASELGINSNMDMTDELRRLLENGENVPIWTQGLDGVLWLKDELRRSLMDEFFNKSYTLSYAFWAAIYDDDYVSKKSARRFLLKYEQNNEVQKIARDYFELMAMPFIRLRYFDSCPAVALWVCFWHDLFTSNLDMALITENAEARLLLNPFLPSSLAWNICNLQEACKRLQAAGLQSDSGKGFISAELVQKLFDAMKVCTQEHISTQSPGADGNTAYIHITGTATGEEAGGGAVTDSGDSALLLDFYEIQRTQDYVNGRLPLTKSNFGNPNLRYIKNFIGDDDVDFYSGSY